jgi:hypothetical protein
MCCVTVSSGSTTWAVIEHDLAMKDVRAEDEKAQRAMSGGQLTAYYC